MSWSPLEIIFLEQHQKSVADKATGTVHPTKKGSTGTARKEDHAKNTTVGLTCPLIPTYIVLDTSDSDVFMSECSEGLVLPLE